MAPVCVGMRPLPPPAHTLSPQKPRHHKENYCMVQITIGYGVDGITIYGGHHESKYDKMLYRNICAIRLDIR